MFPHWNKSNLQLVKIPVSTVKEQGTVYKSVQVLSFWKDHLADYSQGTSSKSQEFPPWAIIPFYLFHYKGELWLRIDGGQPVGDEAM